MTQAEQKPLERLRRGRNATDEQKSGISLRAMLVGLVFVAIVSYVVSLGELVIGRIQVGFLQMPPAAIGIFFFIVLANAQMRRLARRLSLSAAELLMIYCMMVVAAMVASRGILEKIIPVVVTPNYFAGSGNRWQSLFFPNIPEWMVPFDPQGGPNQPVAKQFFEGLRDNESIPWSDWVVPLGAWGVLVLLVVFAFLCLGTILRRQWVENEKLSFPLVQPALELVQEHTVGGERFPRGNSAWAQSPARSRILFWGGIAFPTAVFALNGLHQSYPSIPEISLELFLNPLLVDPPWNAMYYTCLYLSFAAIGFFFLLPTDVLFSVWFFAIFARLQAVFAASHGIELARMRVYGTHAFVAYQTVGAYLVLVAYFFYVGFPHLKRVVRSALGSERVDDSQELMPYRVAFFGLIFAFLLIMAWCCAAGMSLWLAVLEFGVFLFVVALVMARSTAEGGLLMTETSFRPVDLYRLFAPVQTLGPANVTMLAFFDVVFLRDQRGLLLTGIIDGLKIADGARVRRRSLVAVLALGILAALLFAGFLHMTIPYTRGGGMNLYDAVYRGMNIGPFYDYEAEMNEPMRVDWQAPTGFIVGIFTTVFLAYMRALFFWWPLHPLGYALSVSWTVSVFWFSALIAWIIKVVVLRYGGMRLYTCVRPWFVGMVLGEFGSAVIWALIGAFTGAATPRFPWP